MFYAPQPPLPPELTGKEYPRSLPQSSLSSTWKQGREACRPCSNGFKDVGKVEKEEMAGVFNMGMV
ncbi:MAG: hypothetical protein Q9184_004817 [Pyrenodesmia sp. 2 TL-2023]